MSRVADRAAARREARLRRAELRVLAASRHYADALDRAADDGGPEAQGAATEALTDLEAAALHYAGIAPRPRRRRRRSARRA